MRDPLKRITLVFLLVAVIPVAFLVYELGQINRNERIVRETYQNQLDAILYSVNQYSDDVLSSWANRLRQEAGTWQPDTARSDEFFNLISQPGVIRFIYFSDLKGRSVMMAATEEKARLSHAQATMDRLVREETVRVNRLIAYEAAGFRKVEAVNKAIVGNTLPILFALDRGVADFVVGGIVIDLPVFIQQTLAPKMQAVSQGRFVISAFAFATDSLLYSTETVSLTSRETAVFREEIQKKGLWLLPGYYLGITLKGASLDDLVRDRTATSTTILILLMLTLSAGIFFLYRNIRQQIKLSQTKSEFVSNVSHEIRTPLSLIGMFAETLELGRVSSEEKKAEYYGIISKETKRLSRMVNRILNFSQLDANKKRFNFRPLHLNELCTEVLSSFADHLNHHGFQVEFLPEGDLNAIPGDREAASEAIINLIDNAIKYSREKKRITVKTGSDNGYHFVEVGDEGIGIAKTYHRDIFDQFFRAPAWDLHQTKGSGLGLAIVKKIMEAHKGNVQINSAPGKGSRFTLRFPVQKNHSI